MNPMQATPPPQKMRYVRITINFWPLSIPQIQHWFQLCCWEAEVKRIIFFFCGLTTEKELSALVRQMDRHLARPAAFNRKGMRLYNRTSICYTWEEIQYQLENEPSQGPRGAAPLWNARNPRKKAGVESGARRAEITSLCLVLSCTLQVGRGVLQHHQQQERISGKCEFTPWRTDKVWFLKKSGSIWLPKETNQPQGWMNLQSFAYH